MIGTILLTQAEADELIAMEKHPVPNWQSTLPGFKNETIRFSGVSNSVEFLIDLHQTRIKSRKYTLQLRTRKNIVLVRLDIGSGKHRNPTREIINGPHLHIYREGCDDKQAFPIPNESFENIEDFDKTLVDFLKFCHVVDPYMFQ